MACVNRGIFAPHASIADARLHSDVPYHPCYLLQNDLEFLRIRSFKHEIMVAASECALGTERGLERTGGGCTPTMHMLLLRTRHHHQLGATCTMHTLHHQLTHAPPPFSILQRRTLC